ncbi:hypothetical protein [Streptomyces sp. NBC_00631]|uniref:hypothetical protein n=1 Tax=Streptomyces sp. NBC_00631 TaxID=2975793 RepID=UPI0038699F01
MMLDTGDPVTVLAGDFTRDGSYNPAFLCDKNADGLVAAGTESDPGKRQDAATKAQAAIVGTDAVKPRLHLKVVAGIGTSATARDTHETAGREAPGLPGPQPVLKCQLPSPSRAAHRCSTLASFQYATAAAHTTTNSPAIT